jgi:L-methionine (R)-S-oxide reductase
MNEKKIARYMRIYEQLKELLQKSKDTGARMATINALLYHKMDGFFWVGFYIVCGEKLIVGPYQGPVACLELPQGKGVCRASIESGKPVIVTNVHDFPGHIACDSRSKSEIVIPVRNQEGIIASVLDIDSDRIGNFDQTDQEYLEKIVALIYG